MLNPVEMNTSYSIDRFMDEFGDLTYDELTEPRQMSHRKTKDDGAALFESDLETMIKEILMTRPWSLCGIYRQLGVLCTKEFKKTSHSQKEAKIRVLNNSVYYEKRRNSGHTPNLLKTNNQQRRSYGPKLL